MAERTKIEWCHSSVNPTMGCEGCELWTSKDRTCYAGNMTRHYEGKAGWPEKFETPKEFPGRMAKAAAWSDLSGTTCPDKPWLDGLPRHIFIGDMGDTFSKPISFEFIRNEVVEVVRSPLGARHKWLLLTKRATRMAEFDAWLEKQGIDWPANLYAGVSVTTADTLKRVHAIRGMRAPIKFVSNEPAREALEAAPYLSWINWWIVGGESGQNPARFSVNSARWAIRDCEAADRPCFVKQFGGKPYEPGPPLYLRLKDSKGGNWMEWAPEFRVREMPGGLRKDAQKVLCGASETRG